MATIYVGGQTEPFIIHHDLIIASSDFLAKASNGEFKEKDGVVHLKDQDPITLSQYIQWLYTKKIVYGQKHWLGLLKQYIFGKYIQDRGYRNALVDTLIDLVIASGIYQV